MKTIVVGAVFALALMSSAAIAEERGTDAALGAVSGAVVLGPIGAVAGALIGYTAGPSISRSWGLNQSGAQRQSRAVTRRDQRIRSADGQAVASSPAPRNQADAQAAAPARSGSAVAAAPPVQPME
jgi:hypothetical protein